MALESVVFPGASAVFPYCRTEVFCPYRNSLSVLSGGGSLGILSQTQAEVTQLFRRSSLISAASPRNWEVQIFANVADLRRKPQKLQDFAETCSFAQEAAEAAAYRRKPHPCTQQATEAAGTRSNPQTGVCPLNHDLNVFH